MSSILLVEDDYMQREILKKMIAAKYEAMVIYEADSESSALEIINKHDINIFLIDISLKESSGLELAKKIRDIPKYELSPLIFLTTHVDYMLQAFKQIHCYDYIIKPYNKEDVLAILDKFIVYENSQLNKIEEEIIQEDDKEVIITLKNGIYIGIKINDIFFIEVKGKNCDINTINGMYTANNISLKKILEMINCEFIIQSHRAFAININYILKVEKLDLKLSEIYFENYSKTALLGYKFKDNIMTKFKKGKVILC
ncbi:LytTR family DNA-binding domain-containing protein [Clostridium sp. C2-6-12]|uniref:LytR/AlgR family response regulator transcription factor n=1 Tax=Clostridium sp. C2-6-12 TaxID=2698832 RepID=UPI00136E79F0|nr:LytTR family DNA-binding domain-containing protein [Clostridium sp. C2-6-12]